MSTLATPEPPPTAPPRAKVYSIASVIIATVLGAPLAGCIILAINYFRWGMKGPAWGSIVGGVLGTAVIVVLALMIPDSVHIPTMAFVLPQVLIMLALANSLQGARIKEHIAAGGPQASRWASAGIGLGACVVLLAVVFGVVFATTGPSGTRFPVGNSEVYYSGAATRADVEALVAAMKKEGWFEGDDHAITLQLSKDSGGNATLCFVVGDEALTNPDLTDGFRLLGQSLADAPPSPLGHPLTIWLCDPEMTKKKKIVIN